MTRTQDKKRRSKDAEEGRPKQTWQERRILCSILLFCTPERGKKAKTATAVKVRERSKSERPSALWHVQESAEIRIRVKPRPECFDVSTGERASPFFFFGGGGGV